MTRAGARFYGLNLACLAVILAPTAMAPTKGSYERGQPEMQQPMDNMAMYKPRVMRKSSNAEGYPALLNQKTSSLLNEAHNMLSRVKNGKERRWLQAFLHRLKTLADDMERNTSTNTYTDGNLNQVNAQVGSNGSQMPHTPLYAVLSAEQQQPAGHMTSMNPNDIQSETPTLNTRPVMNQAVTQSAKPSLIMDSGEEDELVKELKALHKVPVTGNYVIESTVTTPVQNQVQTNPPDTDPEMHSKRVSVMQANQMAIMAEKARLRANLAQEVSELERLGTSQGEIQSMLHLNGYRRPGLLKHNYMFRPMGRGPHTYRKFFPANRPRYIDSNEPFVQFTDTNMHKTTNHRGTPYPVRPAYINSSYQNFPFNLPPMHRQAGGKPLLNEAHHHSIYPQQVQNKEIKNMIHKLQTQSQNLFQMNYVPEMSPPNIENSDPTTSGAPKAMSQVSNRFLPNPEVKLDGPNTVPHLPLTPSSNSQKMERKTSAVKGQPENIKTSFSSESFPSHHIENEFSDEMKRQLRDGRVIILSDSVVRTNFKGEEEHDKKQKLKADSSTVTPEVESKGESKFRETGFQM